MMMVADLMTALIWEPAIAQEKRGKEAGATKLVQSPTAHSLAVRINWNSYLLNHYNW